MSDLQYATTSAFTFARPHYQHDDDGYYFVGHVVCQRGHLHDVYCTQTEVILRYGDKPEENRALPLEDFMHASKETSPYREARVVVERTLAMRETLRELCETVEQYRQGLVAPIELYSKFFAQQ
ncbi:hypothetical protein [Chitinibacter tainanensis]|uniref:hypothetical protein n=1 Tax=Chitinibacter tainanensis TaxID=230667 RepID=UPI0003FAEA60|nr:hypothetical protein [Chitinibacter tainanensis]